MRTRDRRELLVETPVDVPPVVVSQRATPYQPPQVCITESELTQDRTPLRSPRN
jgi:hypothetical protein